MIKVIFILFFFSWGLFAAEVKLDAKVDRALVSTGDIIMFTVTLDTPKSLSLQVPNLGEKIQGLRVVDFGSTLEKEVDSRKISSQWYKLQADLVGSYILPALELKYKTGTGNEETIKSSEIFIEVESVLALAKDKDKGEKKDIRDIKPIFRSPATWPYYLAGGVLALGIVVAGIYYLKKIRKKHGENILVVPPHSIALDALGKLPRKPIKLYAFTLSEILRIYFEKIFFLPVTDRTIEEIKNEITALSLSEELQKQFMFILEKTDLIKFSDVNLEEQDCEKLVQLARQFVQTTMPQVSPGEAEEDNIV